MIKKILTLAIGALTCASCVSMREYESLQAQYSQSTKECTVARQEAQELREENAELVRQNQNMTMSMSDLSTAQQECEATVATLNRSYAALQLHYDTTVENYMQQLTSKSRDLTKVNKLLEQRNKEIAEKERAFATKEQQFLERQQELEDQQALLLQDEEILRRNYQFAQQEMEALSSALGQELGSSAEVEVKKGRVHVVLSETALFESGRWEVTDKGISLLAKVAAIAATRNDIALTVMGHTDNTAYPSGKEVKDNWDFSVMRASAVAKQLLKASPRLSASRVSAAGHGEYAPKVRNISANNRALNRRIEIIIEPVIPDTPLD